MEKLLRSNSKVDTFVETEPDIHFNACNRCTYNGKSASICLACMLNNSPYVYYKSKIDGNDKDMNNIPILRKPSIIAVDFDGTCVTHRFPELGDNIGAEIVLRALLMEGHKIILYTMRSDFAGREYLTEAINWMLHHKIVIWGVNMNPEQYKWTTSKKIFANLYIDDAALGVPPMQDIEGHWHVDWHTAIKELYNKGYLSPSRAIETDAKLRNEYSMYSSREPINFDNV